MPRKAAPPPEQMLRSVLEGTGLVEILKATAASDNVKLLFRVANKKAWLAFLERLLSAATGWSVHVCQQYFMMGGRMVYGWNFILRPENDLKLKDAVKQACSDIEAAMQTRSQPKQVVGTPADDDDDSFPLVGASSRRMAKLVFDPRMPGPRQGGPSHKGAYNVIGD